MADTIKITSLTLDGEGVGRLNEMAVFVFGTTVGDECEIEITKQKKNFARARAVKITKPSPYRTEPVCPAFGECGGCAMMNLDYYVGLRQKEEFIKNAIRRIGGFHDFELDKMNGCDNTFHYRNKAVFSVKNGEFGFYENKTHSTVGVEECFLCPKEFSDIAKAVSKIMQGRIFIRQGKNEIMVMLCPLNEIDKEKAISIITNASPSVTSIILDQNRKKALIFGKEQIETEIMNVSFDVSCESFLQVNPEMTKKLYKKAIEYANIEKNSAVLDIYCGIGTISLICAKEAKEVIGVEIVDEAIKNAKKNAEKNGIKNADFYAGKAEDVVPKLIGEGFSPDVVILDPPRKGSDEKTLDAIIKASPKRIVYVSCDPSTLARDLKYLCQNGYTLTAAEGFDMFPHTMHVECCVRLCRNDLL